MCPICSNSMLVLEFDGIDIDWCERCRGLWFDVGELELLLKRHGSGADPVWSERSEVDHIEGGKCPRCRSRLRDFDPGDSPGPTISTCPMGHGVWCPSGAISGLVGEFGGRSAIVEFLDEVCRVDRGHEVRGLN